MSLLRVQHLTKRFTGLVAVDDVTFDVEARSITALIGPNGAGKTTCFSMIAGALLPTAGAITLDGQATIGMSPERLCRLGIARTFQIVRPMTGMSVVDNVIVGALVRSRSLIDARRSALDMLEQVGLGGKADLPASALTLPDRKMLELAKAMATRPRLLMLDEVLAGLRTGEADRIVRVLRELKESGVTILLIEHVMRVVMALADKVVVLHHGQKIADGTPAEVAADDRVIESYLGRKAGRA